MGEIKIDTTVIENEISILNGLLNDNIGQTVTVTQVPQSLGKSTGKIQDILQCYVDIGKNLDALIYNTVILLENTRDNSIEVDEASAARLSQLLADSGGS
ncbi:hypothetical protein HB943_14725 [Listeria weihenstephanensis]|uniref:LXG domain-containing protein n=1 Tax=Listeria weihenstephanensis TaxID=1006155 RepID=A0A841ZC48_9LIST|nr:hypothetical protein [Listeria weihenstephanensis]MBC1501853.1 hypothetical protein [Listeria weihenstephanensis]